MAFIYICRKKFRFVNEMGNKKSNKKYSYKSFSEWLNIQKNRKRLGAVLLLLFVVLFSFFPIYWLVKWDSKDISISQYIEWSSLTFLGDNVPAENVEVRLYEGVVLLDTQYTDVSGMVTFYVDSWELNNTYETRIFHNNAENYASGVVDADNDLQYDLKTVSGGLTALRMNVGTLVEWSTGIPIDLATIDVYRNGVMVGTMTTDASGNLVAWVALDYAEYSFMYVGRESIANITMDKTTSPVTQDYTIQIESIFMLISSIGIIIVIIIIWKESQSRIITNKSVMKNLKETKRFDIANETILLITPNLKFKI